MGHEGGGKHLAGPHDGQRLQAGQSYTVMNAQDGLCREMEISVRDIYIYIYIICMYVCIYIYIYICIERDLYYYITDIYIYIYIYICHTCEFTQHRMVYPVAILVQASPQVSFELRGAPG